MTISFVDNQRPMTTPQMRTLFVASFEGALEFYDFVIFVFFTSIIARLFFPSSLPDWVRQAQSFGIFAAGYFAWALGGIVMAHFGDARGRKRVFAVSVALMALPTQLVDLWITHLATVGFAVALHLNPGFSAGQSLYCS